MHNLCKILLFVNFGVVRKASGQGSHIYWYDYLKKCWGGQEATGRVRQMLLSFLYQIESKAFI